MVPVSLLATLLVRHIPKQYSVGSPYSKTVPSSGNRKKAYLPASTNSLSVISRTCDQNLCSSLASSPKNADVPIQTFRPLQSLQKILSASSRDTRIIVGLLPIVGLKPAIYLATKSHSQSPQPSPGSRAKSNARDRNYSARSVKRKRLSGSSVSSRKRSSDA